MELLSRILVFLALGVAISACSDDEEVPSGDGGAAASTGGAGTGTGGSAGTAGSGGSGGGGAMTVQCGTTTCMAQGIIAMFGGQACCADEAASSCGTSMGGGECMPPRDPGMPDPRCTPPAGQSPIPLMGCCVDDMCGLDLSLLQQGCIEYSELSGLTSMFGAGGGFELPEPRRCDASPPEMDDDAGM